VELFSSVAIISSVCLDRFFFVSGSELLEFLSNGNEPDKVMRLLRKVFDSLNKLDLREDATGKAMKMAHASKVPVTG
jgi:hypothetical protein